jgi:hypothetical protein
MGERLRRVVGFTRGPVMITDWLFWFADHAGEIVLMR